MAEVKTWSINKLDFVQLYDMEIPDEASSINCKRFVRTRGRIEGTRPRSMAQQEVEFNKWSQKALSTTVMSISSSLIYLITSCEEPVDVWKRSLRTEYTTEQANVKKAVLQDGDEIRHLF